ncbi:uncharacterized protein EAE97_005472 [Botrytis byssoidea]|uniref:Uncharacterized protein n=1 Tax=Botrytis byssoidea TaxID=139641 RepID=A0A9P5IKK4_9HELO|nr:uncharacterized protein EAE97_005472 [Botrytis byssoidea]KAF7944839.1 hypothetical protein EAE97_005472 [Botrytis byssoidea]
MLFSKHPSKAPDQLELHKAALLYHKQKHTLPPMQQVQKSPVYSPEESIQQIVGASTDSQISIGNVFQDGLPSLPVMYLPEHHLVRLRALKIQRVDNSSSPIVERKQVKQAKRVKRSEDVEKRKRVQNLLPKTDIATHKKPMHISNLFRAHFHKPNIRTASNRLFSKSPKAKIEEKTNTHIEEANKANSIPPAPLNDFNWPLLPPETASTSNLALRPGAEHNHENSETTITGEEENKNESHCQNLESTKTSETITEEKQELDIGPSEASRMKLYQAWKRRILELSGAKEVE